MDLIGLLLIGIVLVFGSIYVGWISWAAWQEAHITARRSKEDGATVPASTWLQHGLTLLFSAVFLLVTVCLCFSMTQDESCHKAMSQLKSLTAPRSVYAGMTWGKGDNQGTLHIAPSSKGNCVTGASLAYIQFDNSDLKQLMKQHPHISWYILSGTQIDDQALQLLAKQDNLDGLVLTDTAVTDDGFAAFYGHSGLCELDLGRTAITDQCLKVVGSLPKLMHLNVSQTSMTDEGLRALAGKLELVTLNIEGTRVTDGAISTLATLRNLGHLQISHCDVSPAAIARLKRALPGCEIAMDSTETELDLACTE